MWSWCGFIYVKPLSSCFRAAKLANDLQICVHVRLFLDPVKMFSDFIKCQRPRICLKSAVHVTLLTRAAVSSLWLLTFLCSSVNVVIVNKWQTVWGKKTMPPAVKRSHWSFGAQTLTACLLFYLCRYGKIVSTKAILDKNTNQCKGRTFKKTFFFFFFASCVWPE